MGIQTEEVPLVTCLSPNVEDIIYSRKLGQKQYEMTNHLGNVLTTVSDNRVAVPNGSVVDYYEPEIVSVSDCYPFGMQLPGRQYIISGREYRFGFNGQEKDDEVKGQGNSVSFKYRIHDPRLGRFLSVDPLAPQYAYNSPYAFAENKLGLGKELEGLELYVFGSNPILATSAAEALIKTGTTEGAGWGVEVYIPKPPTIPIPPIAANPDASIPPPTPPAVTPAPPVEGTTPSVGEIPQVPTPEALTNPDVTQKNDATTTAKPYYEARKKQKTEAEQDIEAENKKIEALQKGKKKAGQTKENTKTQEKEAGQQYEEINKAQQSSRKQGKPNKVESTKKSKQNDKKEIQREAQKKLDND